MKKTLSLMLIASLILAPTYRCMANYELEPENRSMGGLTKVAILGALTATASAGYKLYHWYQMKNGVENSLNKWYAEKEHDLSTPAAESEVSPVVAYAEFDIYPEISDLYNATNRETVINGLRAYKQPRDTSRSLSDVEASLKKELENARKVVDTLKPYVVHDKTKKTKVATWSKEDLNKFYAEIEAGVLNTTDAAEQMPAKPEFTFAYTWQAARYAWNKTAQFAKWMVKKPILNQKDRSRFVEVLKKKDRLETLLAVVQDEQNKTAKKEAPATASDAAIAATLQQQQAAPRGGCAPAPAPAAVNAAQIEAARKEVADAQSGVNAVEDSTPANQKNTYSFRYQMGLAQTRLTEAQKALRKLEA